MDRRLVTGTPQHGSPTSSAGPDFGVRPDDAERHRRILPRGARADTIELEMSVDAALSYIISMGVAEPAMRQIKNHTKIAPPSP